MPAPITTASAVGASWFPEGDPLAERPRLVAVSVAGLLLLHALLAWVVRTPSYTIINDHSVYVFLARSLLDGGYNEIWRVGAPWHAQYPPLFPAFLAGVIAVAGERLDLFHAVVIGWSVAGLALIHLAVRRLWGPSLALVVLAVAAVNPNLLERAGEVMAEPMFVTWIALALYALASVTPSTRQLVLASAASIAATLTRSAGLPVVVAVGVHLLLARRWRAAVAHAAVAAATLGGWTWFTVLHSENILGRSYVADAAYTGGAAAAPSFLMVLLTRAMDKVPAYLLTSIPWQLPLPSVAGTPLDNGLALVVVVAGLGFGSMQLWTRWRPAALFLVLYGGMLAVWPWTESRFVEPISPLLVATILVGLAAVAMRVGGRTAARATVIVVGVTCLAAAVARDLPYVGRMLQCDRGEPLRSEACYGEGARAFFATVTRVQETTADSTIVLVSKDSPFAMLTGRQVHIVAAALAAPPDSFFAHLESTGVGRIVLTHISFLDAPLSRRLLDVCRRLTLEATVPPLNSIYSWVPSAADAAPDDQGPACRELTRYRRLADRLP